MKCRLILLLIALIIPNVNCNSDNLFNFIRDGVLYSEPDHTPPSAPKNVKAAEIGFSYITIDWEPSLDNTYGNGLLGYNVYYSESQIVDPKILLTSGIKANGNNILTDTNAYKITGLDFNKNYWIGVSAIDKSPYQNESNPENIIQAKTQNMVNAWEYDCKHLWHYSKSKHQRYLDVLNKSGWLDYF